tara:strand:+ start:220 stop:873 length:654 start_codon:yes stop_codon:yes gene_type:complete
MATNPRRTGIRSTSTAAQVRIRQPIRGNSLYRKTKLKQIQDRNFLQPSGFQMMISRAPKVAFFGNAVNIPDLLLGTTIQTTQALKTIPQPGEIIEFGDLTLRFLVDENMENYIEVQNWIRGIGFPETLDQIYDLQEDTQGVARPDLQTGMNIYSDGTLIVYDSLSNPNFKIHFENMFPYSLSTLQFDATLPDTEYFTAEVSFKYDIYNIEAVGCCPD